ncbi:hypothetical protein PO124_02175 [Bacillus licheniformis]|nr:hypothetical protein [Bacillus licheniformis]
MESRRAEQLFNRNHGGDPAEKDEKTGAPLIDVILDKPAKRHGQMDEPAGRRQRHSIIDYHGIPVCPLPVIIKRRTDSCGKVLAGPATEERRLDQTCGSTASDRHYIWANLRLCTRLRSIQMTSDLNGWNLPLKDIALIFRGGCIIRAQF